MNKVVFITGASSGLGRGLAECFYRAGSRVILVARNENRLLEVKEELMSIESTGIDFLEPEVFTLDLEDLDSIPTKVVEVIEKFGPIDILVNNAGIGFRGTCEDTDVKVHERIMSVNYFAQIALTKEFLPHMKRRVKSQIIAISSIQGKIALPYRSAYAASKHSLTAFMDSLRSELGPKSNVKLSLITAGYIRTNLSMNALKSDGTSYSKVDESRFRSYMDPMDAAKSIIKAVKRGQYELILAPIHHRLIIYLRHLMPDIFFCIMAKLAAKDAHLLKED